MNLKRELKLWLDRQTITPENIGEIRSACMVPWDSEWNAFVRDQTALREKPSDIWKDPQVIEALKERPAEDIAVLNCPDCHQLGYYNQGRHFSCRFCDATWYVCTEDETPPVDRPYMVFDGFMSLADTVQIGEDQP